MFPEKRFEGSKEGRRRVNDFPARFVHVNRFWSAIPRRGFCLRMVFRESIDCKANKNLKMKNSNALRHVVKFSLIFRLLFWNQRLQSKFYIEFPIVYCFKNTFIAHIDFCTKKSASSNFKKIKNPKRDKLMSELSQLIRSISWVSKWNQLRSSLSFSLYLT